MIENPLVWVAAAVAAGIVIAIVVRSLRSGVAEKRPIVATSPPPANADAASAESAIPPYHIERRPMPTGNDPEQLLPVDVGPFHRDSLEGDDPAQPIYANYRAGRRHVFVELGVCGTPAGARGALATAKRETDAEFPDVPHQASLAGDPAFLKTTNRLGAFMAWTRGGYYFSAHARGGEAELDEFMASFPY